jgi:chorismate synthase
MIKLIEEVKADDDSVGGVVQGVIRGLPVGLGEPVFDKLPADLAKAMMSINATKGFEIGSGFGGVSMRGSQHNAEFYTDAKGDVRTKTNYAGGTLGGISSGETVYFRVAIKPVSTIAKQQNTVSTDKKAVKLEAKGRHDPCVLPRAIPIVDAMAALVIMDHYLRHKAQNL